MSNETQTNQQTSEQTVLRPSKQSFCKTCRDFDIPPPCKGHGGSGGGSSEESSQKSDNQSNAVTTGNYLDPTVSTHTQPESIDHVKVNDLQIQLQMDAMMQLSISTLLANNLLTIENNPDNFTLRISWSPLLLNDPNAKILLENYLQLILTELENFQKINNINSNCLSRNNNEVNIQLPAKYYDKFIEDLFDKKLLPHEVLKQQLNKKIKYAKDKNHFSEEALELTNEPEVKRDNKKECFPIRPRSPLDI